MNIVLIVEETKMMDAPVAWHIHCVKVAISPQMLATVNIVIHVIQLK
jgi:hypothetical protein